MAASGQYPNELPEVLEFVVGDELIGIRGGVLFRASTDVLSTGGGGVTVVQEIENNAATVPSSAALFGLGQDFAIALGNKANVSALDDYATLASLDDKANLDSPVFTGTPTAPTPDSNDDSTALATTEFVHYVTANALTLASVRYAFTDESTSTSIAAGKVTAAGRDIINSTAASPITLTLPVIGSPNNLNIGESVNIRQGGLGIVTVAAGGGNTLLGNGVFTAANETKTAIVFSATQWVIIGG